MIPLTSKTVVTLCLITISFLYSTQASLAQNRRAKSERLDLLIRNVTLVDVVNKKILPNKSIGVKANRITLIDDHSTTHLANCT